VLFEKSALASITSVFIETLAKNYNLDLKPVLTDLGLDLRKITLPGARYPDEAYGDIWNAIIKLTGDDLVGLAIGSHVRPTTFHALGYAWMASSTLADALHRLERYDRIISAVDQFVIQDYENYTVLTLSCRDLEIPYIHEGVDAYFMAILKFCQWSTDSHTAPIEVRLQHPDHDRASDYVAAFGAPVIFDAEDNQLVFDKELLEKPLPGDNEELASLNDRVVERYLEALNPQLVANQVRALLVKLLSSGDSSQERIASQLARSTSSLQRQLSAEGSSFVEIRDETRKTLAMGYIREGELPISEVAFLLGFSDQSNFSRAFKRWAGVSPKQWRELQ
jgi:AraC-like DNA-binding protein